MAGPGVCLALTTLRTAYSIPSGTNEIRAAQRPFRANLGDRIYSKDSNKALPPEAVVSTESVRSCTKR